MGNLTAKDTRRISFDNTFAMSLTIPKSIQDDDELIINRLETKKHDVSSKESNKSVEIPEDEHAYWTYRIEYLKNEHQLINKIIENEYEKTIENTKSIFDMNPKLFKEKQKNAQPCYDWRSKIVKCYEDNPHQTLLCSATVEAFNNCVASCHFGE